MVFNSIFKKYLKQIKDLDLKWMERYLKHELIIHKFNESRISRRTK